jgi:hypothetical protein
MIPILQVLENRIVPSITYHNGEVISFANIQAIYYGIGWVTKGAIPEAIRIDQNLNDLTQSKYMSILANTYGVGKCNTYSGQLVDGLMNAPGWVDDSVIQYELGKHLNLGDNGLIQPSPSTIYVVFIQPGTAVTAGPFGSNSQSTFAGYHSVFTYRNQLIPYIVIPYQGPVDNSYYPNVKSAYNITPHDQLTHVMSHEIIETFTDPTGGGWYDDKYGYLGEIGDLVTTKLFTYHDYVVQAIASIEEQPLYPDDINFTQPGNENIRLS